MWEAILVTACVMAGAGLSVVPHVIEYRALTRLADGAQLLAAVQQVQRIDAVSLQIANATANWQAVQDDSGKALSEAREISRQIATEARSFQDFLKKANDTERNHLRLEVDKLRRAEAEWLQVLVRILDHVHALSQGALRSGHPALIDQVSGFQRACVDSARRVGLVPFVPKSGDSFDPEAHQTATPDQAFPAEPKVSDVVATGYRFQGQLVRKALVLLQGGRVPRSDLSISAITQRRDQLQGGTAAAESPSRTDDLPGLSEPVVREAGEPDPDEPSGSA